MAEKLIQSRPYEPSLNQLTYEIMQGKLKRILEESYKENMANYCLIANRRIRYEMVENKRLYTTEFYAQFFSVRPNLNNTFNHGATLAKLWDNNDIGESMNMVVNTIGQELKGVVFKIVCQEEDILHQFGQYIKKSLQLEEMLH